MLNKETNNKMCPFHWAITAIKLQMRSKFLGALRPHTACMFVLVEPCVHLARLCCACCTQREQKKMCVQMLPGPATDTYVWPARGPKAVIAVAFIWTRCVHTASVLTGADTGGSLCTLIDVCKQNTQKLHKYKCLLKMLLGSFKIYLRDRYVCIFQHKPIQRAREWSSL